MYMYMYQSIYIHLFIHQSPIRIIYFLISIELSLPWDPVESIHKEMKIALRNLVNVKYTEKENRVQTNTRTNGMEKERFTSDLNVFEWSKQ